MASRDCLVSLRVRSAPLFFNINLTVLLLTRNGIEAYICRVTNKQ